MWRRLIARAADLHGREPQRINVTDALVVIGPAATQGDRGALSRLVPLYVRLMDESRASRLQRFRRQRQVARAVKAKTSSYALECPEDPCVEVDFAARLRFLEAT